MKQIPLFTAGLKPNIIETEQGITSYYDLGTSTAPCILLVPGYLCSCLMYRDLASHLIEKGFRVIMYDLYGTGGSVKQSKEKYSLETFVEQLESVIMNSCVMTLSIIGYSMGGLIAAAFAKNHKSMIKHLFLLSPAGINLELGPPNIIRIMKTPFLGPKYFDFFYDKMMLGAVQVNFVHPEDPKFTDVIQFLYLHIYASWCANPSFSQAACGIMRDFQFADQQNLFTSISDIPTTVVLAKEDVCVTYDNNKPFWEEQTSVKLYTVEGCGHWGIYEKKEEMFDIIDKTFC